MVGVLFYTCIKDKFIKISYLAPMEYYIIFIFLFYIFLELGVQNSSGILTDIQHISIDYCLNGILAQTINLDVHPGTFNSRFLEKSYWRTWLRLETLPLQIYSCYLDQRIHQVCKANSFPTCSMCEAYGPVSYGQSQVAVRKSRPGSSL